MNLKPYLTFARTGAFAVGVFAFVLFSSWIAGQCRQWRTPKPFPPLVDVGAPVAGPSSAAPTVDANPSMAVPDLSRDEVRALAEKYGLVIAQSDREKVTAPKRQQSGASADVLPQKEANIVAQNFPMLLAEESFKHAPSGVNLEVAAWLPGWGERVDLRARFLEWTPPPVATAKIPVCQTGPFLRNEARFEKEFGAGALVTPDGIGPGGFGSLVYRGPSTGSANWGLRGMVAAGQVGGEMTGYGLVAGKVSW